ERISALALDGTVHLLGRTDRPREVIRSCHALMSASQVESFGMTLIEAMAEGRPVIASATGGHLEIVRDGVNGFLCPAGDPEAFADRMEWVIRNPEAAAEAGSRGFHLARKEYSGETSQQLFGDLLENMIATERAENPATLRDRY